MGFNEEGRQATPPPWGWPPAAKEKAHSVGKIVYDRSLHTTHNTKDRRHEQEKVYHKTRSRATPHGQTAGDARHGMERIREPVRADIATALRKGPQYPVRHVAARAQARGGVADHQARQPLDVPGVRHRQGEGIHKQGKEQHGRPNEAHGGHGHPLQACGAEAQALAVRCEDHDQGGHAGQGRAVSEDVLQPHRGGRHGRLQRPDAVPPRTPTKGAPAGARGEDRAGQKAAQGQAERSLGGKGARPLGDGHDHFKERLKRRAPGHARPLLKALRHRASEPHQPGRGHQGHKEDEGAQGAACHKERDDGQRLRVPRPEKTRQRVQGRDLLHEGLRLLRERRHRELQPPRQEMVPERNGLQPAHKTADPAARRLHKLNPQGITQRRNCICLRFTSGQGGLRTFC